jgi:hypothetical protein
MFSTGRFVQLTVAAVATMALGACTGLRVTTDSNPNASVASCHTYAWAQEHIANLNEQSAFGNPLNADRLRVAIESNLAARGIQKAADRSPADCIVGYSIGSRLVADYDGGWGVGVGYYGWRRGWGYGGWGYDDFYPYGRNEGRISIDVFDARSRQAIWHGSVEQNVVGLTGPAAAAKIDQAAAAIFTKFPVAGPAPAPAKT